MHCVTAITPMEVCSSNRCAVTQHQCSAALVLVKCIRHCPVPLCKTGSQQAWVTAITLMEICCSYRCAVTQQKCTAALVRANCIAHCSVLLCRTGSQQARVTAITPTETCCSHRCAVTQQKCTAALVRANAIPLFSAALQNRLAAGLCHCKSPNEELLFITVGFDPTPIHCGTGCGKMHSHCSVLLCNTG